MPDPTFKGTHPKLDTASECIAQLTEAWDEYTAARIVYAETRLGYNWTHSGGRYDKNHHRRTEKMSEAYDNYFEAMDTLKRAHAAYKTAFRELLRGHLL